MTMLAALEEESWYSSLSRRRLNFRTMLEHLEKIDCPIVVETGTAWDKGNYEYQGQSTLVWDWASQFLPALAVYSIDIRQEGIDVAKPQTKIVEYLCGDGAKVLSEFELKRRISLLYLDSHDWTPEGNLEAAMQAFFEFSAVWAALPSGCLICVDDRHGDMRGKHWVVEAFMERIGIKPLFKNHQIAWLKP